MPAQDYTPHYRAAGERYNIDPMLLRALAQVESDENPNISDSSAGAQGPMQIMPKTQQGLGMKPGDARNYELAVHAGADLMDQNLKQYGGDVSKAVLAYHGGTDEKNWGPKTRDYLRKVTEKYSGLKAELQTDDDLLRTMGAVAQPRKGAATPAANAGSAAPSDDDLLKVMATVGRPGKAAVPAATTPPLAAAEPGAPEPAQPAGPGPSTLEGIGKGAKDVLDAGAQLIAHSLPEKWSTAIDSATRPLVDRLNKLVGAHTVPATAPAIDQDIQQAENVYQAQRAGAGQTGVDWARMGGNVAASIPLAATLPVGSGLAGAAGFGALGGAATGAMSPVTAPTEDYWGEKKSQALTGAAVGAVTGPVAAGISRLIQPKAAVDPAIQALRERGVTMTPGQLSGGPLATAEEKLSSLPLVGDIIKNAQRHNVQTFNQAVYGEVMAPLGKDLEKQARALPAGQKGVEGVKEMLGNAYNKLLPKINLPAADALEDLKGAYTKAAQLPETQQSQFGKILNNQFFNKVQPGDVIDGKTFKGIESEIGREVRGYKGSASFDDRKLGDALEDALNSMRGALIRSNPEHAKELSAINEGYAMFTRLRGAASSVGSAKNEGVFTPEAFLNAVVRGDKSVGKGSVATGNALMQDLATQGVQALGSKYPDSGTPGRAFAGALASGALGGGIGALVSPWLAAPLAGAALYTRPGEHLAGALMASRPALAGPVAAGVRAATPALISANVYGALGR